MPRKTKDGIISNWIVKVRCTVIKEVDCHGCTRQQAEADTWEYAEDEMEISQEDWEVISVKENV